MKKLSITLITLISVCSLAAAGIARETVKEKSGEELFKAHCAVCHPNGGNIVNPKKTLQKKDREKNNIRTSEDIIKNMRKPGTGMTPFDKATISDKDAKKIADYILKTFK